MAVGIAEPRNRVKMIGRRVAFVSIEAVARIAAVQLQHQAIACHLRNDGGGCNRRAAPIAMAHAALRHRQVRHAERVDEHDIGERREGA